MPYTKKYVGICEGFDLLRRERRSFFCPNKLWEELLKQTYGIHSVSEFIKQAIVEKMSKDELEKEEFFKELLF
ncbi:MAG: hypothetical protein ACLFPQ_01550 [Candidatus Woesearchaeota archaeon]